MTTSFNIIDSDTHVDETDATWDYLPPEKGQDRPTVGTFDDPAAPNTFWLIDGAKQHKARRSDVITKTTAATRELIDVQARLRHMDELGVDVQVIYPTLFLKPPTTDPDVELDLVRSYNRWLADRTATSGGRLRWVCVLPFLSPSEAVKELQFAFDHGACGVLKKGDVEAGHAVWEEYFFPVYAEAERLGAPICFHQGTGKFTTVDGTGTSPESDFIDLKAPAVNGISAVLSRGTVHAFPRLRFGCIEVGASWVVLVDHMYKRRLQNRARAQRGEAPDFSSRLLDTGQIYTSCEVSEDFPTILRFISEDRLLAGSDYSHADPSQEHGFIPKLLELVDLGVLSPDGARKILHDNPKAFYGL